MILSKIPQRKCVDHNTNGKTAKEGYKVPMEQRVSKWSGSSEEEDGHCTNISISGLGKDIPCACRCITDSTWSYLGAARSRRLGSLDSIRRKKISDSEHNYNSNEREGLAMVYALHKFKHYLLGKHFKMFTDHSTLKYLVNKPLFGGNLSMVTVISGICLQSNH
jgi:hypothetical protein